MPRLATIDDRAVECTTRTAGSRASGLQPRMEPSSNGGLIQISIQPVLTKQIHGVQVRSSYYLLLICLLTLDTTGLTYTGSVHANTSIHGLSIPTLTIVYFQAANNSIMQLTFTNSADVASTASFTVSEVAVGLPGTRLETSGGEDSSDSFFYLYFQNGTTLVQMYMQRDSTSGQVSAGGSAAMLTMGTITIPTISFYAGPGRLDTEYIWMMLRFVGVLYLAL
jgi:hypothetical protein